MLVMDTTTALDALRSVSVDDLRRRLAELEAESRSLRTLLRSALARERAQRSDRLVKRPKGGQQ